MATERVGITVRCEACGLVKKPIGRAGPLQGGWCDDECPSYREQPRPGSLWPGERESDFGYPVSDDGTLRVKARCRNGNHDH